ncbi:MAG: VWA domain-containing protein [Rikenellaceae bacterium]
MYSAKITRNSPALIMLLVDRSGSMAENIRYDGVMMPKSEVVVRILNTLIDELLYRCRKGSDYRNYFEIAIYGYNGNEVYSMLDYVSNDKSIFSVSELVNAGVDHKSVIVRRKGVDGEYYSVATDVKCWVSGHSGGNTPTYAALKYVHKEASNWVKHHKSENTFVPILVHISDGEASDADEQMLLEISDKLKNIKTDCGNLLFINVHLASSEAISVMFPQSIEEVEQENRNAVMLYKMSSDMPEFFNEDVARIKNLTTYDSTIGFKAVAYNTSVTEFVKVLSVGTSTII